MCYYYFAPFGVCGCCVILRRCNAVIRGIDYAEFDAVKEGMQAMVLSLLLSPEKISFGGLLVFFFSKRSAYRRPV